MRIAIEIADEHNVSRCVAEAPQNLATMDAEQIAAYVMPVMAQVLRESLKWGSKQTDPNIARHFAGGAR